MTTALPMLELRASLSNIDEGAREVDLVFSTGAPVVRHDYSRGGRYIEVLSMDPKHVRLERLNNGAPVLDTHSAASLESVLGAVKPGSARITGQEGRARVRFSRRSKVDPVWQDVRDRIITKVSVGYVVHRYEETPGHNGALSTRKAVDWEPYEISFVPIAADDQAHVRARQALSTAHADADRERRFRFLKARWPPGGVA